MSAVASLRNVGHMALQGDTSLLVWKPVSELAPKRCPRGPPVPVLDRCLRLCHLESGKKGHDTCIDDECRCLYLHAIGTRSLGLYFRYLGTSIYLHTEPGTIHG